MVNSPLAGNLIMYIDSHHCHGFRVAYMQFNMNKCESEEFIYKACLALKMVRSNTLNCF